MPRGIVLVRWVATLLAMVAGWPETWRCTGATALRAVVEEATEETPPRLIATIEVLTEGVGVLQRRVLVEVGTQHVGSIPWPHLRTVCRIARGPPVLRSVVDEVHDRENLSRKEKTC
jgi:hypothetical protein